MAGTRQTCGNCGYQWTPRGRAYSIKCPDCGVKFGQITQSVSKPRFGCLGCTGVAGVLFATFVVLIFICGGFGTWLNTKQMKQVQQQIADADAHYEAGRRDEAIAIYKETLDHTQAGDRGRMVARIISFELTAGNKVESDRWIRRAIDDDLPIAEYDVAAGRAVADARRSIKVEEDERERNEAERRVQAQPLRTWTDASGKFSVKASFAGYAMGTVNLRKEDGSVIKVDLDQLSADDQEYVQSLR
jgi:predicted RNA-binding Zn-ribbon protein involved in translation (DUF1610 family)